MALESVSGSYSGSNALQAKARFRFLWLLQANQKLGQEKGRQVNSGFTLIEALIAMLVVSIVMVAITPPIFMATASRVQQRRAQQALQLAQGEIDRIRTVVERGTYTADELPAEVTDLTTVAAAGSVSGNLRSTTASCNNFTGAQVSATEFLPVDVTGDCQSDFLVQSFRTPGPAGTTLPVTGFKMGVRVYVDTPALRQSLGSLKTQRASLKFTSGLGQQALFPAAVLYSTVVRNDTSESLQNYRTLCNSTGGC